MAIKLSKREKYSIYLIVGFICLFVFFQFILFPFIDERDRLKRTIKVKTKILKEMIVLKSEYDMIKKKSGLSKNLIAKRKKGFTLFSFLDKNTGEAGIKDHISYMKPSSSVQKNSKYKISLVEMKLQAITLEQLTTYLYKIETSKNNVFIKRISITKTGKQEQFINAVLHVETIEI
jgi:general secretion pathway protein M